MKLLLSKSQDQVHHYASILVMAAPPCPSYFTMITALQGIETHVSLQF